MAHFTKQTVDYAISYVTLIISVLLLFLIEWHLGVGFAGCDRDGIMEFEDDVTDAEIEETVRAEVFSYIDWGYCAYKKDNGE